MSKGITDFHALGLTSCKDDNARGWLARTVDDDLEQVCWKEKLSELQVPFCLYKKHHLLES